MSPTAASKRQQASEETRRRILEAAMDLLAEGGLEAMSSQSVAKRSGVTRGSIAFHFGTSDELRAATAAELLGWARRHVEERLLAEDGCATDRVVNALSHTMHQGRAAAFPALLSAALVPDSPVAPVYAEHFVAMRAILTDHLAAATPPVANPEQVAVIALGATLGITSQHLVSERGIDRDAAFSELRESLR